MATVLLLPLFNIRISYSIIIDLRRSSFSITHIYWDCVQLSLVVVVYCYFMSYPSFYNAFTQAWLKSMSSHHWFSPPLHASFSTSSSVKFIQNVPNICNSIILISIMSNISWYLELFNISLLISLMFWIISIEF